MKLVDLTGHRFGRLVVISFAGLTPRQQSIWSCTCDCGNHLNVIIGSLKSGNTRSCGCIAKEILTKRNTTHGLSQGEKLYGLWRRMIQRCTDPNVREFKNYGGRGISVCAAWGNYPVFREWAIVNGYDANLTIDRKNNDGDYKPDNCRWIPREKQAKNKSNNHLITFNGETKILQDWAESTGMESSLIRYRLRAGWTVKDALTLPASNTHNGGLH